jgi:nickel/cobalt exporter
MAANLGAMHALEPGHAKTLTAAYLIGIRGTWRETLVLGLSVGLTHSLVVVAIAIVGIWLGSALVDPAQQMLSIGSAIAVIILGTWSWWRHWSSRRQHRQDCASGHLHPYTGHPHTRPDCVQQGERPRYGQIVVFGASGGWIPCPGAIAVMLLAISTGAWTKGLILVSAFSLGLAGTLLLTGLWVVWGVSHLHGVGALSKLMQHAGSLSAALVITTGVAGLLFALHHQPSLASTLP